MSEEEQIIVGPQSKFQADYLNSSARILVAGGELRLLIKLS